MRATQITRSATHVRATRIAHCATTHTHVEIHRSDAREGCAHSYTLTQSRKHAPDKLTPRTRLCSRHYQHANLHDAVELLSTQTSTLFFTSLPKSENDSQTTQSCRTTTTAPNYSPQRSVGAYYDSPDNRHEATTTSRQAI